jgi:type IX secretion system substrate protein
MKNAILISMFAIAAITNHQTLKAQITLEHTFDTAQSNLYVVNLEVEGDKYIVRDYFYSHTIKLYNLDHSLFKTLPYPNITLFNGSYPSVLYFSEHLFNTDDTIEYMLTYTDNTGNYNTKIVNEIGNIIFSADSMSPLVMANVPQAQLPIYNTSNGTKMILSFIGGTGGPQIANLYSLGGTLSASIQPIGSTLSGNQIMENIYPNPSNGNTTIEFNLPQGENAGQLVIYNMQGVELKRYTVDNTFHTLLLNNSEFHSGTYFYQLQTASGASGAKKMIVIKN